MTHNWCLISCSWWPVLSVWHQYAWTRALELHQPQLPTHVHMCVHVRIHTHLIDLLPSILQSTLETRNSSWIPSFPMSPRPNPSQVWLLNLNTCPTQFQLQNPYFCTLTSYPLPPPLWGKHLKPGWSQRSLPLLIYSVVASNANDWLAMAARTTEMNEEGDQPRRCLQSYPTPIHPPTAAQAAAFKPVVSSPSPHPWFSNCL